MKWMRTFKGANRNLARMDEEPSGEHHQSPFNTKKSKGYHV